MSMNFLEFLKHKEKQNADYQILTEAFKDSELGKAKDLNNRLKSYFNGRVTGKTLMLVNDIVDFDYIVTSSELESLILEITLIKNDAIIQKLLENMIMCLSSLQEQYPKNIKLDKEEK